MLKPLDDELFVAWPGALLAVLDGRRHLPKSWWALIAFGERRYRNAVRLALDLAARTA